VGSCFHPVGDPGNDPKEHTRAGTHCTFSFVVLHLLLGALIPLTCTQVGCLWAEGVGSHQHGQDSGLGKGSNTVWTASVSLFV
jgi:hypothetical protein